MSEYLWAVSVGWLRNVIYLLGPKLTSADCWWPWWPSTCSRLNTISSSSFLGGDHVRRDFFSWTDPPEPIPPHHGFKKSYHICQWRSHLLGISGTCEAFLRFAMTSSVLMQYTSHLGTIIIHDTQGLRVIVIPALGRSLPPRICLYRLSSRKSFVRLYITLIPGSKS